MTADRPAIRCHQLRRTFGDVTAVDEADLKVEAGTSVSIQGVSGSGKSTLLNILGLMDHHTSGSYHLFGHDVAQLDPRERARVRSRVFGFVFQAFNLVTDRTVEDNIATGLLYSGIHRRHWDARIRHAVETVGLVDRLNARTSTLSGGEQQRVAIARAVVADPRLLLCDEPTGNLDAGNRTMLLDLLDRLQDDGITIITVTHDPAVAGRSEHQLEMVNGRLQTSRP